MPSTTSNPSSSGERLARWAPLLLALLVVQFAWRSYLTHRVFNDTADEEIHIACGLEVWERRQYTLEAQHPPLARVVLAALPYLAGLRGRGQMALWRDTDQEFYWRTLSLARLGNLVFLPFLVVYVYFWGRKLHGPTAGLGASALVALSPNLLAHASLATLDFGAATTLLVAAFHLWRWSGAPGDMRRSLAATLAMVCAILTKFSALFLLPVLGAAFFGLARSFPPWRLAVGSMSLTGFALWAAYGFTFGPLPPASFPIGGLLDASAPAPRLVRGVLDVLGHNAAGHQAYLLGEVRWYGWWYYFPVVLALKSTLPMLLLAGTALLLGRRAWAPLLGAAVVLAICLFSSLNLGVRHILVVYSLLALPAGGLLTSRRRRVAVAAVALVAWHAVESFRAHPDYLAYFNQTVRGREDEFLLDSNLDWGQDLERLRQFLRDNRIGGVHLSYFGRGEPIRRRIAGARPLGPSDRPAGWVAVSKGHLVGMALDGYDLGWLKEHQPKARIGKSILVYYFSEPPL